MSKTDVTSHGAAQQILLVPKKVHQLRSAVKQALLAKKAAGCER